MIRYPSRLEGHSTEKSTFLAHPQPSIRIRRAKYSKSIDSLSYSRRASSPVIVWLGYDFENSHSAALSLAFLFSLYVSRPVPLVRYHRDENRGWQSCKTELRFSRDDRDNFVNRRERNEASCCVEGPLERRFSLFLSFSPLSRSWLFRPKSQGKSRRGLEYLFIVILSSLFFFFFSHDPRPFDLSTQTSEDCLSVERALQIPRIRFRSFDRLRATSVRIIRAYVHSY